MIGAVAAVVATAAAGSVVLGFNDAPLLPQLLAPAIAGSSAWFIATLGTDEVRAAQTDRAETLVAEGRLDGAFNEFRANPASSANAALGYRLGAAFNAAKRPDLAERTYRLLAQQAENEANNLVDNSNVGDARKVSGLPQRIGRYDIEGLLGRGAMGAVYLAMDTRINRSVALKVVNLEREFDASGLDAARARFFQEAESAGRLHHPAVTTIYDVGETGALAYIAMEYVTGRPLASFPRGPAELPLPKLLELIARVAEALAYAHDQRVIHRDIKPGNILYNDADDSLKIMDFGVAQLADAVRTKTGLILGTPVYMAPEQLFGDKIGGYSDLFSLGVTLYELLTGELPFPADELIGIAKAMRAGPPKRLAEWRDDLPDSVQGIVDMALARAPQERFQDGWAMADALRACNLDIEQNSAVGNSGK